MGTPDDVSVGGGDAAAKRARRRAAAKSNKAALKQAEKEQKLKFQKVKQEEKVKKEKGEEGGEEEKEDTKSSLHTDSSSITTTTEYLPETLDLTLLSTPGMSELAEVLERFHKRGEESMQYEDEDAYAKGQSEEKTKEERIDEEIRAQSGENSNNQTGGSDGQLSRRKQKERDRLAIADLKQLVSKPEVVELHDIASADPKLLVYLKSYRNTVPVPQHWCQKRKYLQNKHGDDKIPFQLPLCIVNTGITKMRGAQQEKDATATNKQKQRAKMQPKMGKYKLFFIHERIEIVDKIATIEY